MIRRIRNFERFVNDLPTDWKIGIMLGILVAAWVIYQIEHMLAGGG
jgi:hypothetical protein